MDSRFEFVHKKRTMLIDERTNGFGGGSFSDAFDDESFWVGRIGVFNTIQDFFFRHIKRITGVA